MQNARRLERIPFRLTSECALDSFSGRIFCGKPVSTPDQVRGRHFWARQNRELARNFFVAYIRGVREYCQAYHNGPNRQEVIDIAVRTGVERRQELLYKYPWPSRDPNGLFNMASLLDIQSWYMKAGLSQRRFSPERIATNEYVDYAVHKLGLFAVENKDSTLPGCR
jgi:NitT/TauT family transport system substrate-binding protein